MRETSESSHGRGDGAFTEGLKNLLADSWKPRLIQAVAVAYLKQREKEWSRGGQDRGEIDDGLIEVCLTLHGCTETREKGLELFERLMALNPYGMAERLGELGSEAGEGDVVTGTWGRVPERQ